MSYDNYNADSIRNPHISMNIIVLAKEVGQYATLFVSLSMVASYSYNLFYFHNIDGSLLFQSFISLLTFNDYLSTMFLCMPVGLFALVAVMIIMQVANRVANLLLTPGEIAEVFNVSHRKFNKNKLAYIVAIFIILSLFGYNALHVGNIQAKYNWLIAFLSSFFLVIYSFGKANFIEKSEKRKFLYVSLVVFFSVFIGSGVVGNYMFDMAISSPKKTILISFSGQDRYDLDDITSEEFSNISGARSLENGLFFITHMDDGEYAFFVQHERNYILKRRIADHRDERFICLLGRWIGQKNCSTPPFSSPPAPR